MDFNQCSGSDSYLYSADPAFLQKEKKEIFSENKRKTEASGAPEKTKNEKGSQKKQKT